MNTPKKILLVDDDRAFVESNKDLLEAYGYQVRCAYDGASGLALAKRERPDLLVLDVMMTSGTEGFEVARKIPHDPDLRGLRVLLVTGISRAMGLPFQYEPDETWLPVEQVLNKPIAPDRFLAEVQRVLALPPPA